MEKNEKLIELTSKFLNDFYNICAESNSEKRSSDSDSFHFNYSLPEILVSFRPKRDDIYAILLDNGFEQNVVKEFCNDKSKGFTKEILYVIENFNNQDDDRSKAYDLNVVSETKIEDSYSFSKNDFVKKEIKYETTSFMLNRNTSGFTGKIEVIKKEGKTFSNENDFILEMKVENVNFYNSKKELIFNIKTNYDGVEETTIHHFKHCADINSFYTTIMSLQFKN